MSLPTPTPTLNEELEEGLEHSEVEPEDHEAQEAERRAKLARAFRHLGAEAEVIRPDSPGDGSVNDT